MLYLIYKQFVSTICDTFVRPFICAAVCRAGFTVHTHSALNAVRGCPSSSSCRPAHPVLYIIQFASSSVRGSCDEHAIEIRSHSPGDQVSLSQVTSNNKPGEQQLIAQTFFLSL